MENERDILIKQSLLPSTNENYAYYVHAKFKPANLTALVSHYEDLLHTMAQENSNLNALLNDEIELTKKLRRNHYTMRRALMYLAENTRTNKLQKEMIEYVLKETELND